MIVGKIVGVKVVGIGETLASISGHDTLHQSDIYRAIQGRQGPPRSRRTKTTSDSGCISEQTFGGSKHVNPLAYVAELPTKTIHPFVAWFLEARNDCRWSFADACTTPVYRFNFGKGY